MTALDSINEIAVLVKNTVKNQCLITINGQLGQLTITYFKINFFKLLIFFSKKSINRNILISCPF